MKTVAIHQPNYLPWLGYFYKIHQSDVFVFLDDVQYSNKGMHNYCYIKTPQGPFRLKIPVKQSFGDKIYQVSVRDELKWREKHLKTIETFYSRAAYFENIYQDLSNLIQSEQDDLTSLNIQIISFICKKLSIHTEFVKSSDLTLSDSREERIYDICGALNGDVYYSGTGAKAYQKSEEFEKRGIDLRYSEFNPLTYDQLWGPFDSNVSIIDYLMNHGYEWNRVVEHQEIK